MTARKAGGKCGRDVRADVGDDVRDDVRDDVSTDTRGDRRLLRAALVMGALAFVCACGVRGRPQPPLTPAELGRGQPTFKRATEEFRFKDVPSADAGPDASAEPSASPKPTKPSGDSN